MRLILKFLWMTLDMDHGLAGSTRKNVRRTVGVFRCVLERTMSRKSAAVGTGAMAFSPLVDMVEDWEGDTMWVQRIWLLFFVPTLPRA